MRAKITKEDREWAKKVKERYNNKCIVCGKEEYLNAHHIIPRQIKQFKHDLRNGIPLCPSHHRFSFVLSAHQNPYIFYSYMFTHLPDVMQELNIMLKQWKD